MPVSRHAKTGTHTHRSLQFDRHGRACPGHPEAPLVEILPERSARLGPRDKPGDDEL